MPSGDRYILNRIDIIKIKPCAIPPNTSQWVQVMQWETISYFTQTYCIQLTLQYQMHCYLTEQVSSLSVYTILARQYPETLQSLLLPGDRKVPLFPSVYGENP